MATALKHLVTPRSHAWLRIRPTRPLQMPFEGFPSRSVLGVSSWLPATHTLEAKARPTSLVSQHEETVRPSSQPQASPSHVLSDLETTQHRAGQGPPPQTETRARPGHPAQPLHRGSRDRPHPHRGRALSPHRAASKVRPSWSQGQALLTVGMRRRQGRVRCTLRNSPDPSTRARLGQRGERPGHVHTKHPDSGGKLLRPSVLRRAPGHRRRTGRQVPAHAAPVAILLQQPPQSSPLKRISFRG